MVSIFLAAIHKLNNEPKIDISSTHDRSFQVFLMQLLSWLVTTDALRITHVKENLFSLYPQRLLICAEREKKHVSKIIFRITPERCIHMSNISP